MDYAFGLFFVSESRKIIKHGSVPSKTAHNIMFPSGQAPSVLQAVVQVEWFKTLIIFVAGFLLYISCWQFKQNIVALTSPCACAETF